MNLLLLWQTQEPATDYASPRYVILGIVVVLYIVYRMAVRRSRRIPPRRPKY